MPPLLPSRAALLAGSGGADAAATLLSSALPLLAADCAAADSLSPCSAHFRSPCPPAGPSAEAQEPLAALPGPPEAAALESAAGVEREQAMAMPRDATADVWLREGARSTCLPARQSVSQGLGVKAAFNRIAGCGSGCKPCCAQAANPAHPPAPSCLPCLSAVADHVRATVTGRQQRQRKQSRWLQETFDPNAGGCQMAGQAGRHVCCM